MVIEGAEDPIVQVIDEIDDEVVYTIRINGDRWDPKVFSEGVYKIRVTADGETQEVVNVESNNAKGAAQIELKF